MKGILVQGANTLVGNAIIESLIALNRSGQGNEVVIRAGISHEDESYDFHAHTFKSLGAEVVHLDLQSNHSMNEALKDISHLIIIPPYNQEKVRSCEVLVDLAHLHNVNRIILVSYAPSDGVRCTRKIQNKIRSHREMEWILVGCALLMDYFCYLSNDIQNGQLSLPLASGRIAPIWAKDLGEFIAHVIIEPGLYVREPVHVTGPQSLSGQDVAALFAKNLHQPVTFCSISPEEFRMKLIHADSNKEKADAITEIFESYTQGFEETPTNAFEKVVGRPPHKLDEFVRAHQTLFTQYYNC